MTATVRPRPVAVDELRRAWAAVQAGDFRAAPGRPTGVTRRPSTRTPPEVASSWTPSPRERVLPVAGCAGSSGATIWAVALATGAAGPARVIECASVTASGLVAASTTELGVDDHGWMRGSRDQVHLERAGAPRGLGEVPTPSPAAGPTLTVVDVSHPVDHVLAGAGWITDLLAASPLLVLTTRASVPGLRRLESCADLVGAGRVVAAVLGPPRKRWPRDLTASLGPLTRTLIDAGRLVDVPEDRDLAVRGLTPDPLPAPLLTAAASLLPLLEGIHPHVR